MNFRTKTEHQSLSTKTNVLKQNECTFKKHFRSRTLPTNFFVEEYENVVFAFVHLSQ